MLTCREFADFLMAYLEDELPGGQREDFEAHIYLCPPCVNYLDSYRETVELGRTCLCESDDAPPPEDAPEGLVQAILASRRRA